MGAGIAGLNQSIHRLVYDTQDNHNISAWPLCLSACTPVSHMSRGLDNPGSAKTRCEPKSGIMLGLVRDGGPMLV